MKIDKKLRREMEEAEGNRLDDLQEMRLAIERSKRRRGCMTDKEKPLSKRVCSWCGQHYWTYDASLVCAGCEWVNHQLPQLLREYRVGHGQLHSQQREDITSLGGG